jgi:O-methyltransferase involved in polyketide biosynthesis
VDVGGAAGGFLIPVLQRYSGLRGTIFDLAAVQPVAQEKIAAAHLDGRMQFVAGDFFHDPLPRDADLIVLGHILHDWNREDGTRLLQAIFEALPSGGAVLVHEHFLDDTRDGPFFPAFLNLNMLVAAHGEERTAAEYEAWLQEAGFQRTQSWRGNAPRGYVLGWKA